MTHVRSGSLFGTPYPLSLTFYWLALLLPRSILGRGCSTALILVHLFFLFRLLVGDAALETGQCILSYSVTLLRALAESDGSNGFKRAAS